MSFNDILSTAKVISRYRIIERMGKEVTVVCFNVISRYLPGGTDKNLHP
jgi:hypothetical protein